MINNILTDREIEILKLVADGYTNKEISKILYISVHTAHAHISAIARKLNATSRTQAAVNGIRMGLIE